MPQWCWGICWNSHCLDFYDRAEIFYRSMDVFLPPTAEVQAFILSRPSPLPDPHPRQSLLSSRTNRCFSCYTVCCLIPRQGTVWCIPMQLSTLEGIFPWVCKEMQPIIILGFTAALTKWPSGLDSQMSYRKWNAKYSTRILDIQLEWLGSAIRLWFQMRKASHIFLTVTCAWNNYNLDIKVFKLNSQASRSTTLMKSGDNRRCRSKCLVQTGLKVMSCAVRSYQKRQAVVWRYRCPVWSC